MHAASLTLLGLLSALAVTHVAAICCTHDYGSTTCGDCTYTPAAQCCATGRCNIFCCNCGGSCRTGACDRRKRDLGLFLDAFNETSIDTLTEGTTAYDIIKRADQDQDGRLSVEEAHEFLGTSRYNRFDVEKLDKNDDKYLSAEEINDEV